MSVTLDSLNLYNNTAANAAANKTNKLEQTLNGDFSKASDQELMDVCKEFEAYFLEQVFKEMQKTVDCFKDESSSPNSNLVDFFKDSAIQSLASTSTESQGLGLAQTMYEQMKRNYNL